MRNSLPQREVWMMAFVQHNPGCPALGRKIELDVTSPKGHVRRKSLGDERWPRTITGEDKRIAPNTGSLGSNKTNKEKQARHDHLQIPKIVVTPPRGYPSRVYNGRSGSGFCAEDYDTNSSGWRWVNSNENLSEDKRKSFDSWPLNRGLSTSNNDIDNNKSAEYWSFRRPSFDAILNKRDVSPSRKTNISYLPYKRLSGESWSYVLQKDEFGKYVMTRRPYATTVNKIDPNANINKQNVYSKSSEHIYSSRKCVEHNTKTQQMDKYRHLSKSTESLLNSKNIGDSIARTNKQLDKLDKQLSKSSESISNSQIMNDDVKELQKSNRKQNLDEYNLKLHKDVDKPPTGKTHKIKSNGKYCRNNESLNQSSFHTMFKNAYVDFNKNTSKSKIESSSKNEINKSRSKQSNETQHKTNDSPKIKRNLGSSNLFDKADVRYNAKGSLTDVIKSSMIQNDQEISSNKCSQSNTSFVRYNEITKSSKNPLENKRECSIQSVSTHSRRKNSIENVSMKSSLDSPTTQRRNLGSSPKITRKTSWTYTPVNVPSGVRSTPSSPSTTRNQRSPSLISDLYKKPHFTNKTSETYNSFPKPNYPSSNNLSCETSSVKRNLFARKYSIPFLEKMSKSTDSYEEKSSPFSSPKNIRRYFKRAGSLPASSKTSNSPVKRLIEHFSVKIKEKDSNKKQKKKFVYSDPIIDFKDESESDCDSPIFDLPPQYFFPTIEEMPESKIKQEPCYKQWHRRRSSDCSYSDRGQWPRWSLRGVLTVVPIPDRLGPKPDSAAQYLVKMAPGDRHCSSHTFLHTQRGHTLPTFNQHYGSKPAYDTARQRGRT